MSLFTIMMRQERSAMLGWGIGLFLYVLLIGLSYASFKDSTELDEIWQDMPEAMREAFGGTDLSITSVSGYLDSQLTSYMPVILGILAVTVATKRLAGAEETGLLDHLLARPINRLPFILTLTFSIATATGIILLAVAIAGVLGFAAAGVSGSDLGRVFLAVVDLVPAALFWIGGGLLLGAAYHRRGPALGVGIAVVLGMFGLQIVANVVDPLAFIDWLTPYGYYARSDLFHGEPDLWYWTVLPLVGAGMAFAAAKWFERKDLQA